MCLINRADIHKLPVFFNLKKIVFVIYSATDNVY